MAYLQEVQRLFLTFTACNIQLLPRIENTRADALAKLASTKDAELLKVVPVDFLVSPSIEVEPQVTMPIDEKPSWMDPIMRYIQNDNLPESKDNAKQLRMKAARYIIHDEKFYRKRFSSPLLLCVNDEKARYIMREIHKGICGNHSGGQALANKIL
ncbi:hypothetical protein PanWU01x14_331270 [Parasponia andersonii]|uniref:RNase H type-1 domain-containing protein n=1 Tax=Parasponia andersonii TaxID=3476 RepID=A0A2P5AHR9_PARAD|nr:hypothetical protein PanWU01x14_331270 [Parasponia andersonii]